MSKWRFNIDTSVCDQDALKEYTQLESKIERFIKDHPERKRTPAEKEELSQMVRQRPGIMRRLGKFKVDED